MIAPVLATTRFICGRNTGWPNLRRADRGVPRRMRARRRDVAAEMRAMFPC